MGGLTSLQESHHRPSVKEKKCERNESGFLPGGWGRGESLDLFVIDSANNATQKLTSFDRGGLPRSQIWVLPESKPAVRGTRTAFFLSTSNVFLGYTTTTRKQAETLENIRKTLKTILICVRMTTIQLDRACFRFSGKKSPAKPPARSLICRFC